MSSSHPEPERRGPLSDVRILDLSRLIPGPFATLILRDLGAAVDKIEDAGAGDYLRHFGPQRAGSAAGFHALNRGKRSAVVDLKRPEGVALLKRLLPRYDVLFEQFRPGVLDRLGLGHAALAREHPRLVVCALTGYGQHGPLAHRAGHDLNYLARAGLLAGQGPADRPPQVPGFQVADASGGMWCAIAILAALRERDRTGRGQVIDVAMADGVHGFAALSVAGGLAGPPTVRGEDVLTGGVAPYNTYTSSDGAVVALAALEPKFWLAFCQASGLEADLGALLPGPHQAELKARVAALFAARTAAEWTAFGAAHDCCVTVALRPDELPADAHTRARGLLATVGEGSDACTVFRTPVTPRDASFPRAPRPGEHSREVLADGGLDAAEIDALVAAGVVKVG
ncbi:MAG: CoA transferase [Myxococcales bacterium]|nr:CoA transferase [Myxococcales bacterium]